MTNEREQREKAAGDEKSGRWGICTIGLLDPAPDDSAAPLIPSSYDTLSVQSTMHSIHTILCL